MRRKPKAPSRPFSAIVRVVVLIATPALSIVGACQTFALWRSLPSVQARRLDRDRYAQALRDANADMSANARQGLVAANISSLFTAALRDPSIYEKNRDTVQQMLGQLRGTQLGRLQLAAFLMLAADRNGQPPEAWWPTVQPVLAGLEHASFAHFMGDLIDNRTRMFGSLDLTPGAARVEADDVVDSPHGPFLQSFTAHLKELAEARRLAGDATGVALCECIRLRLLRQWLLESSPIGLRLLAADLLANDLAGQGARSGSAQTEELVRHLREWRTAYHQAVVRLPQPVPMAMLGEAPPVPEFMYGQIRFLLANTLRLAVRTVVALVVTIVCVIVSFRTTLTARTSAGLVIGAVAATAAFLYAPLSLPGGGLDDLRRLSTTGLGWPRDVFVQAAATVAFLSLWAIKRPAAGARVRGRAARLVFVGSLTCLISSAFLAYTAWSARGALSAYDGQVAANSQQNKEYAVIVGTDDTALMRELRQWDPGTAGGQ